MNRYPIRHGGLRVLAAALAIGLFATGCAETGPAEMHTGNTTEEDVRALGPLTAVHPGESKFTQVVKSDSKGVQAIIDDLKITDYQYPVGWEDEDAPTIGPKPVRVDGHVALSGAKSNYLDNDIACDTVNIDPSAITSDSYIAGIAISDSDDPVLINWPKDENGTPAETATVCFAEDNEPEYGAVLFMSETDL